MQLQAIFRRSVPMLALAILTLVLGCGKKPSQTEVDSKKVEAQAKAKAAAKDGDHEHEGEHGAGPHGGTIVEFGKIHAEFTVDHDKKSTTVYILSGDLKKAVPLTSDKLVLSIRTPAFTVDLKPMPLADEPKGLSSRFTATHDNFGKEQEFEGTITAEIDGKPYSGDFKEKPEDHKHDKKTSQAPKIDPKEAALFLTAAGKYTKEDIAANGDTVPSVKYKGLKISHDAKPKAGDKLCPISMTKANAKLTWVVGGQSYEFCCPPCVDEFVENAKTLPDALKPPGEYVK